MLHSAAKNKKILKELTAAILMEINVMSEFEAPFIRLTTQLRSRQSRTVKLFYFFMSGIRILKLSCLI